MNIFRLAGWKEGGTLE